MTFDIEKFVALPTQEELISLKKDELLMIVKYYKLEDINRLMRKAARYIFRYNGRNYYYYYSTSTIQ